MNRAGDPARPAPVDPLSRPATLGRAVATVGAAAGFVGVAAVSTRDRNPDGQRDALVGAGCDEILGAKPIGKLARRPALDQALLIARAGDQLVVTKLDRLGRSLEHLIALSRDLQARGVDLVVLDQGIDTSTAVGRMFFQILGAIAEFEHALMSERTRDGLEAARGRGRTGGQKPKLTVRQAKIAQAMYDETACAGVTIAARTSHNRSVAASRTRATSLVSRLTPGSSTCRSHN